MTRLLSSSLALVILFSLVAAASAQEAPEAPSPGSDAARAPLLPAPPSGKATVTIRIRGLKKGRAMIMDKVPVVGSVKPYRPGQRVRVSYFLNGKKIFAKQVKVRKGKRGRGRFVSRIRLKRGGKYAASAKVRAFAGLRSDRTVRKSWKVNYKAVGRGQCGNVVAGFKKALRRMGYLPGGGKCFNGKTGRAVLAYRKVNDMSRNSHAGKGLVKRAYSGRGGYRVRHRGAGDHVEAPLGKQVLVFAKGDKPYAIYPISSGAPSTPTVRGHFQFGTYTQPGYNNLGMYYSYYFYGGYAVHGYHSVPNYPASHGCIRTFISDQPEIYNRIYPGLDIYVF
jgi:hypothetical protein